MQSAIMGAPRSGSIAESERDAGAKIRIRSRRKNKLQTPGSADLATFGFGRIETNVVDLDPVLLNKSCHSPIYVHT
jgi:hypothetical protein